MKVKIIGRKVYLPKALLGRTSLPERGEVEAIVEGDEVRLRPIVEPPAALRLLEAEPTVRPIAEMAKADEVEDA